MVSNLEYALPFLTGCYLLNSVVMGPPRTCVFLTQPLLLGKYSQASPFIIIQKQHKTKNTKGKQMTYRLVPAQLSFIILRI